MPRGHDFHQSLAPGCFAGPDAASARRHHIIQDSASVGWAKRRVTCQRRSQPAHHRHLRSNSTSARPPATPRIVASRTRSVSASITISMKPRAFVHPRAHARPGPSPSAAIHPDRASLTARLGLRQAHARQLRIGEHHVTAPLRPRAVASPPQSKLVQDPAPNRTRRA